MHGHRPRSRGSCGARTSASSTLVRSGVDSKPLYRLAMSYNRGLNRDKDGIRLREGARGGIGAHPRSRRDCQPRVLRKIDPHVRRARARSRHVEGAEMSLRRLCGRSVGHLGRPGHLYIGMSRGWSG